MSVIRVRKDKNYFAASNVPFNDENLSWEARGVMGYLLSKPDDWQVKFNDLINRGPAGVHKMRGVLKELEENGYLKRDRIQDEDGRFEWVSTIYENPSISRKSVDGKSKTISRLSVDGKPHDLTSTDSLSTELKTPSKSKTPYVQAMERLESIFAEARGCPLPDWDSEPKVANKRWRTPLKKIWEKCDKDTDTAAVVVESVTGQMRNSKLTFDAPDQILKTAFSYIIDNKNGKQPSTYPVPDGI